MGKVKAWLNKPQPVRKRWQVLLSGFIEGLGNGIRDHRLRDLERRIEALEGKHG